MQLRRSLGIVASVAGPLSALPSLVCAQALLTPIAQDRRIDIDVSATSSGVTAVYNLESAADSFDPFNTGISGLLTVDTARSRGVAGLYTVLTGTSIVAAGSGFAWTTCGSETDSAMSNCLALCDTTFVVSSPASFLVDGLTYVMGADQRPVSVDLATQDGLSVFSWASMGTQGSFQSLGKLAPGSYRFVVSAVASVGSAGINNDESTNMATAGFFCQLVLQGLARVCPCDWNHDGAVNSDDLFEFMQDFFRFDADFNHSGSTDSQDLLDFMSCYLHACQ